MLTSLLFSFVAYADASGGTLTVCRSNSYYAKKCDNISDYLVLKQIGKVEQIDGVLLSVHELYFNRYITVDDGPDIRTERLKFPLKISDIACRKGPNVFSKVTEQFNGGSNILVAESGDAFITNGKELYPVGKVGGWFEKSIEFKFETWGRASLNDKDNYYKPGFQVKPDHTASLFLFFQSAVP